MADNYTFSKTNGATTNPVNQWTASIAGPTTANKTITIPTKDKYLDRNIVVTVTKPPTVVHAHSGGVLSGSATATPTNIELVQADPGSAVSLTAKATGSVTAVVDKPTTAGWQTTDQHTCKAAITNQSLTSTPYYVKGVTLGVGKQFEITNAVTDKVTIKYDSAANCLDFVFS